MIYKYTIPCLPPSLNKYAGRQNVWEYREKKTEYKNIVALYCRPRPPAPIKYAVVSLVFYFPDNRGRDYDNYLKMLLDGLTGANIIIDDNFKAIPELKIRGAVDREKPRVEIEIAERSANNESFSGL